MNQLVSIFSATDSVLKSAREKKQVENELVILVVSTGYSKDCLCLTAQISEPHGKSGMTPSD